MLENAISLKDYPEEYSVRYSFCTLVTDFEEYGTMLESFQKHGFDSSNSEFIYADNTQNNTYTAFDAYNLFLRKSRGLYLILCHQDIELMEHNEEKLYGILRNLDDKDSLWAVAGNAGGKNFKQLFTYLAHEDGLEKLPKPPFPKQVNNLDENFLIINGKHKISFSYDLRGFHFYGTDICLIADVLGLRCYVIDFLLLHKSRGNANENYYAVRRSLIKKYKRAFRTRLIRTTISRTVYSANGFLLGFRNSKIGIFLQKSILKIKRRLTGRKEYWK